MPAIEPVHRCGALGFFAPAAHAVADQFVAAAVQRIDRQAP